MNNDKLHCYLAFEISIFSFRPFCLLLGSTIFRTDCRKKTETYSCYSKNLKTETYSCYSKNLVNIS